MKLEMADASWLAAEASGEVFATDDEDPLATMKPLEADEPEVPPHNWSMDCSKVPFQLDPPAAPHGLRMIKQLVAVS